MAVIALEVGKLEFQNCFFAKAIDGFKSHKSQLLGVGKMGKKLQIGSESNAVGLE